MNMHQGGFNCTCVVCFHIAVGINGSTLVDLQALPRWSVSPLTGGVLAA